MIFPEEMQVSDGDWQADAAPYLRPTAPGQTDAWQQEAASHGRKGGQRLRIVEEVTAPDRVARGLRLTPGAAVIVRRRSILLDGEPVELTDSYYAPHVAGGTALAEPRKIPGGAVTLLSSLGYDGAVRHEDVSSREPTAEERELLGLGAADWVLDICRLVTTASGEPFEITIMTIPARGRTLHYTAKIG
jgi:GntR family transcriptional regulator